MLLIIDNPPTRSKSLEADSLQKSGKEPITRAEREDNYLDNESIFQKSEYEGIIQISIPRL